MRTVEPFKTKATSFKHSNQFDIFSLKKSIFLFIAMSKKRLYSENCNCPNEFLRSPLSWNLARRLKYQELSLPTNSINRDFHFSLSLYAQR